MYIPINEYWMFRDIKGLSGLRPLRLRRLIEYISREIDEYCNTRFEPTTDNYCLDFSGSFHVRKRPLLEVAGLSLNGSALLENTDFYVYADSSKIEITAQNTGGIKKALEISYIYGYSEVPVTVKQVIVELMKFDVGAEGIPSTLLQSENWDGEYSYSRFGSKDLTATELRKNIFSRLDGFKVLPITENRDEKSVKARLL